MALPAIPDYVTTAFDAMLSERAELLTQLAERQPLLDRLARIRKSIAMLGNLWGLDDPAPSGEDDLEAAAPRVQRASSSEKAINDGILSALRSGPMTPADVGEAVGLGKVACRNRLRLLEARGLITATGSTASRRVALAPARPAKEVP